MNFINKFTPATILLSVITAFAQDAATELSKAQKAYVSGNWKEAASAYEKACPMQPKDSQAECLLWNVLALSQTGDAASFKKAGKRLDSLIQKVNPQENLYADLMMTSAQFRLYLGKFDLAAQDLIHAIETSKPQHNVVLQKVCAAVKAKTNNETLNERCELLKKPDSLANLQKAMAEQPATLPLDSVNAAPVADTKPAPNKPTINETAKTESVKSDTTKAAAEKAVVIKSEVKSEVVKSEVVKSEVAKSETAKPEATKAEQTVSQAPTAVKPAAPAVQDATPTPAAEKPAEEYWILQLGAYSVKAYADLMVNNLKKQKIACTIVEQPRGEKILYLVQTGHFATKEQAIDFAADKLVKQKIEYQPLLRK